jgi:hypothetical protein
MRFLNGSEPSPGAPVSDRGGAAPKRLILNTTRRFFDIMNRQSGVSSSSGIVHVESS